MSRSLPESALQILLQNRLGEKRSPEARKKLTESRDIATQEFRTIIKDREAKEKQRLEEERPTLLSALRYSIVTKALAKFVQCARLVLFPSRVSLLVGLSRSLDKGSLYELSPEQSPEDLQRTSHIYILVLLLT